MVRGDYLTPMSGESAFLVIAVVGVTACSLRSTSTACTAVGCSAGASLDLTTFAGGDRVVTEATVCIDDHCETQRQSVGLSRGRAR